MPSTELRRKTLYFTVSAGLIVIVLLGLPVFVVWLRHDVLPSFGIVFNQGTWDLNTDSGTPTMAVQTMAGLVENALHILRIILWMALIVLCVRFLTYLIFGTAFRKTGQTEISSLLRTVLSIIIYIVAFFVVFQSQYPNIQLAPLFTGSAILGIVVGLALQETLGNLFAGIALQADQPFQVGDVVTIPGSGSGVVETVSWRGVKIRTFQNKLLIISNAALGKQTIEVAPRGNLNARIVNFGTVYTHSPTQIIHAVRDAIHQAENVSQKIRPIVRIHSLGDSGVEWEVKYWLDNYSKYNDTDALVRQRIWYAFKREKIEFAFPTRTIHVEQPQQQIAEDELRDTIAERLCQVSIFAPLSEEETDQLAHATTTRIYSPGEAIVKMGSQGNSMFVIARGRVHVQVPHDGQQKVINQLGENDFFGEMSMLTGEPRTATVIADEETEVLRIDKAAVKPLFESNPELVEMISEMVEERKRLLRSLSENTETEEEQQERGVLNSIRKFFGLG